MISYFFFSGNVLHEINYFLKINSTVSLFVPNNDHYIPVEMGKIKNNTTAQSTLL